MDALEQLSQNARITVRRAGSPAPEGRSVVYWMQHAQRALDNPALETAIAVANALDLPLIVYFGVIANYPGANWRHYHFLAQGLRDVAHDLAEREIPFVVRRAVDGYSLESFLAEVGAAMLIGDENVCRKPERWRRALATRLTIPFWTVDADVVVPSAIFNRSFVLLHHFRPHLRAQLDHWLRPIAAVAPLCRWTSAVPAGWDLAGEITDGFPADFDRRIRPVDTFTGGTHAAVARLREFTSTQLADYNERRNHPELRGTSQMSPYLHYGHISPITIALAARQAAPQDKADTVEKFLDELIGWRELSVLFVRHNAHYDSWECAEPWAKRSLLAHAGDPRPWLYTLEQLERAETHDELWNAAQREMVATGWMHNYMRMYWAKKILEWSPSVAVGYQWAVTLNDRYELDGRDPNGYAGIAWAMVGKHDRPWFDRPVFGLIRYMAGESTGKKFDSRRYIAQHSAG